MDGGRQLRLVRLLKRDHLIEAERGKRWRKTPRLWMPAFKLFQFTSALLQIFRGMRIAVPLDERRQQPVENERAIAGYRDAPRICASLHAMYRARRDGATARRAFDVVRADNPCK